MKIDFDHLDPARLVDTATPADLVDAVHRLDASMQFEVEALDYVHQHWVLRALRARADAEQVTHLRALAEHLRRAAATNEATLQRFAVPYATAWRTLAALVDHRIELTQTQDLAEAMQREHVPLVLEIIARERTVASQERLRQLLEARQVRMEKANLSRILKLLEEAELIARERHGQEKSIVPGVNFPPEMLQATPPNPTQATRAAHRPRRDRRLRALLSQSAH